MLNFLPGPIIGLLAFSLYAINTFLWLIPIIVFAFLKVVIPLDFSRKIFSYLLDLMASNWILLNTWNQKLFTQCKLEITGLDQLNKKEWYLVLSNHQSWVDIVVLQRILHGKIPFLKFFLKKELIYVPFLGLAWWALDFPFMKRYSQSFLRKNPHLIGTDLETTRKACEKFKYKPVSVMNFIEGTRFTPQKYAQQKPKFKHLLRPKAGGIAFVLDAMGDNLSKIVNTTIYYPDGIPNFLDFICGRVKRVQIDIKTIDIDEKLTGDYFNDKAYKASFQKWVNDLWVEKDQTLELMRKKS